jgi:putative ABC transport system ATP-binding protein
MTGQEGFRFADDPLADPVFGTSGDQPADGPAAVCRDVVKTYRTATESVTALDGVTLSIPRARVTVVVGPSGSGKSSLLRLLACIDRPDSGEVRVAGQRVESLGARARRKLRQRQVAYLFQRPGEEVHAVLDRLGLGARADHRPAQLSGGEQQRLAVACGVIGDPALVVADEPTAELDTAAAERVLTAMEDLTTSGVGFVISSHDPRVMAIADGFVRLDHGRVVA